jgi:hypothetical protein
MSLVAVTMTVAIGGCLAIALTREVLHVGKDGGPTDGLLFRRIVDRVRAGEGYYEAAGREQRARGYPTRSPFNWRLPTFAWLFGGLPGPTWARSILMTAALAAVILASALVMR